MSIHAIRPHMGPAFWFPSTICNPVVLLEFRYEYLDIAPVKFTQWVAYVNLLAPPHSLAPFAIHEGFRGSYQHIKYSHPSGYPFYMLVASLLTLVWGFLYAFSLFAY